jgi:hypothetical protein
MLFSRDAIMSELKHQCNEKNQEHPKKGRMLAAQSKYFKSTEVLT